MTIKTKVVKRDSETIVDFDKNKIIKAIESAMKYGTGIYKPEIARCAAYQIENDLKDADIVTIHLIEEKVMKLLNEYGESETALAYQGYRSIQNFKRSMNTTDEGILGLINASNEEVMNENSNKNSILNSTQRDLIAGEVSKDLSRRRLLPAVVVQAHDEGILHFHDLDYFMQPMFNCCNINIQDMLDNGTVINGCKIDSPHSFQVACTVMTQIVAQVASGQYGGQTISLKWLGKYLKMSREKYYNMLDDTYEDQLEDVVDRLLKAELRAGIQTIQYQINTLMSSNGQSPFLTIGLDIDEEDPYVEEVALIVEEFLKQRIQGIKNEQGVYVTPAFPKVIYILREHNCLEPGVKGKYDYITELAIDCNVLRLYPDYISAKKMKELYEGNVFFPMGCRSWLSPWKDENGNYKFEGRFNMGVVTINLPQIGILSQNDEEKCFEILERRLEICRLALMCRYNALKGVRSDVSPVHWQHGAIARLEKGEKIDKLLENGYSTISLGYIGLYELTKLVKGVTHTSPEGQEFALKVMKYLDDTTKRWKEETGIGFGVYGCPAESLCYRFAKIDKQKYGDIKDVTDKGYYNNSFHVDVREEIDAFSKLKFEAQFQPYTKGGNISYIEMPNMSHNKEALRQLVNFIYHNTQYAEFNTKSDYCYDCGQTNEILINDDLEWECPYCGNKDKSRMSVVRRTCGYLGSNFWNKGKTQEIKNRVLHL